MLPFITALASGVPALDGASAITLRVLLMMFG